MSRFFGTIGAIWGVGGILALLIYSCWRLSGVSIEAFAFQLDWRHWSLLILNTAFMAYSEGYRGFQLAFSPRVVARAKFIAERPTWLRVALAPLFCMSYFEAPRNRLVVSYVLTVGIVLFIVGFQYLSQPWRGLLDVGVVVGLTWGVVTIISNLITALTTAHFDVSPEVPLAKTG
ncbi:MAG: hypothetical protein AAF493_19165, partial [Pseudomonadota bacterium]